MVRDRSRERVELLMIMSSHITCSEKLAVESIDHELKSVSFKPIAILDRVESASRCQIYGLSIGGTSYIVMYVGWFDQSISETTLKIWLNLVSIKLCVICLSIQQHFQQFAVRCCDISSVPFFKLITPAHNSVWFSTSQTLKALEKSLAELDEQLNQFRNNAAPFHQFCIITPPQSSNQSDEEPSQQTDPQFYSLGARDVWLDFTPLAPELNMLLLNCCLLIVISMCWVLIFSSRPNLYQDAKSVEQFKSWRSIVLDA